MLQNPPIVLTPEVLLFAKANIKHIKYAGIPSYNYK